MAVIEAMAAGIPVIASTTGGLPALVDEGVTGLLFQPGDHEALARALMTMLQDRTRAECMGLAARAVAAERFQRRQVAAKYLALYQEVAGGFA